MTELSNSLADLAERVRVAHEAAAAAERMTAEKALEAGRLLCQAKEACAHGEWAPFLARAGVHERQARRLMQLARAGLTADTVSEIGGIKAALEWLSTRRLPAKDECLLVSRKGWMEDERKHALACVSLSIDHPGFYDVAGFDISVEPAVGFSLRRPVKAEPFRMPDGTYVSALWDSLEQELRIPKHEQEFQIVPDRLTWEWVREIAA